MPSSSLVSKGRMGYRMEQTPPKGTPRQPLARTWLGRLIENIVLSDTWVEKILPKGAAVYGNAYQGCAESPFHGPNSGSWPL